MLVIHPISVSEIEKDNNINNKDVIISKIKAYSHLESKVNPYDDDKYFELIGKPKTERDKVDSYLLYCVYENSADFFLTEDPDIIKQATVLNIADRVMNLKKALNHFKTLKQKKAKHGDAPILCFYKKGDNWYVGENGKEIPFRHMKGFEHVHFLLSYPYKNFTPKVVYHSAKSSEDIARDATIPIEDKNMEGFDIEKPLYNGYLNAKAKSSITKRIEELQELLDSDSLSIDQKENLEDELKKCENILAQKKPQRDSKSSEEKARLNIYRSIMRVLETIGDNKSTAFMTRYLNKSTIEAKDYCIYNPSEYDTPLWILHPNETL